MKRNVYQQFVFSCIISSLLVIGCDKNNSSDPGSTGEKPGQIAGFGNTPGEPSGSPFSLPKGITLKGEIRGNEDGATNADCVFDGQGMWVSVKMTVQNDSTGAPVTVEFPPGLVITTASEGFQNGLLVERVVVTIPPATPGAGSKQCQVSILAFCANDGMKPSDATATYKLGPVTDSPLLKDFIKKLSGKKINYKEFPDGSSDWFENQEKIQDALWKITNGKGLNEADLAMIRDLPNR